MTTYTCELCGKDYLQKECVECGTKIAYKIVDREGYGLMSDSVFKTKAEVIRRLVGFHSYDYSDERYQSLEDFIKTLKTEDEKIAWLCEHGYWDIEEIIK